MQTKHSNLSSRLISIIGTLVVMSAVILVGEKLLKNWPIIAAWHPPNNICWIVLAGGGVYALSSFCLSFAWFNLLKLFGQPQVSGYVCLSMYSRTQIAKYIPGNIFHLAGRHVFANRLCLSQASITGANLYEAICIITAASCVSVACIGVQNTNSSIWLLLLALVSVALPFVINAATRHISGLRKFNLPNHSLPTLLKILLPVYLLYVLFFLVASALLLWVVYQIAGENTPSFFAIAAIFSATWIAGFITPGSPAGLGIREALIVGSLTGIIGESQGLLAALVFRTITVTGDLMFFGTSFLPVSREGA